MSLSALIWGQSQFDEAVDKATSELRLAEEDIALNLEICDQIRSKSVPAKDAVRALKKRLNHKNPNVQLLSLGLTDTCVKNGGDQFLNELASREFMDNMVSLLKMRDLNIDVKNKMLRLIQNWSIAFEGKYTLSYVGQVYRELKGEGFVFPPKDLTVSGSAMIDTATAPEWIDSDVCLRCRSAFTFTNRKHHCRNCGRVFDQACSSKSLPLPHFGINQEVRVCDGCHTKLTKAIRRKESSKSADFSSGSHHQRHPSSSRKHRSERGFDADLQRAIEMSLAESGVSNKSSYNQWQISEPPLVDRATRPSNQSSREEEDDPELKAAIEASLREASAPKPSAPVVTPYGERGEYSFRGMSSYMNEYATETPTPIPVPLPKVPNNDLDPRESDDIMTFSQTVQDAQAQGGSGLSRIPNVNELYNRANSLRPKLSINLDETGRKEQMLSEMHEKLSEAVKLYDNLLTQRVSHHTWRSASSSQIYGGVYSQPPPASVSQYRPMNDWTSQVNIVPTERPMNYESVPAPPIPSSNRPVMERQASYTEYGTGAHLHSQPNMHPQQQTSHPNWVSPTAYTSPPAPSHEQWPAGRYQSVHGVPSQTTASQSVSQPYTNVASPVPLAHQSPSPQSYRQPIQTSVSQTYAQPVQSPPPSQPVQPYQQSPPPVVQQQYAPVNVPPVQPFVLPQPQPQQAYHQVPSATLSRHSSMSHSSYVHSPKTTLARSNTVASSSHPQSGYTAPNSRPLQNAGLPAFPSVPTSEPTSFYTQTTNGFEQTEEKKEALLIDL